MTNPIQADIDTIESIRCDCPDCAAAKRLAAEVRRLRAELTIERDANKAWEHNRDEWRRIAEIHNSQEFL